MTWHDWLDLLIRWAHVIAGIAWIGSSFYFIWLDQHLEPPPPAAAPSVVGGLWMVHSGGFYQVERRKIGPGQMPATLHWFKWEAAITWITGMLLLVVVYYLTGGAFLAEASRSAVPPGRAALLGLGAIALSWLIYDALWQSPLARRPALAGALTVALLGGATALLCGTLGGRAAFIHVGALLGTIMVANVWMRILPAQQRMIDATAGGREPDFTEGERAKRRSVHNSYMTFPVLVLMTSNHFPALYASPANGWVLALLAIAGVAARHIMIGHGAGRVWAVGPVLAALAGVFLLTRPAGGLRAPQAGTTPGPTPSFAEVQAIVQARCVACHSQTPRDPTFGVAPAGVSFDDPAEIRRRAPRIYVRAVQTKTMPLANKTGLTDDERSTLARWIERGAPEH